MTRGAQIAELAKGYEHWEAWREVHPQTRPDLSGVDFGQLTILILERQFRKDGLPSIGSLNLRDCDLSGARLTGICFKGLDCRGADLSRATMNDCVFEGGAFAPTIAEVDAARSRDGTITTDKARELRARAANLTGASAYGAVFKKFSFSFADLSEMLVDEATRFVRVGVVGTRITRAKLNLLDGNGGLSAGRIAAMQVIDDVATLRASFSGIWNTIHVGALAAFLTPYAWFLGKQWWLSGMGDPHPAGAATGTPILHNLLRYVASGGSTWQEVRIDTIAVALFGFTLVYNAIRFVLWFQTKRLEHRQAITGVYNEFRLTPRWRKMLQFYRGLSIVGLIVVALHTLRFLMTPVPSL